MAHDVCHHCVLDFLVGLDRLMRHNPEMARAALSFFLRGYGPAVWRLYPPHADHRRPAGSRSHPPDGSWQRLDRMIEEDPTIRTRAAKILKVKVHHIDRIADGRVLLSRERWDKFFSEIQEEPRMQRKI